LSATLATALFGFALGGPVRTGLAHTVKAAEHPPPQLQPQNESERANDQADVKTFSGKVTKSSGKFVLEESSMGGSYLLDDQKTAKKYEGKTVIVTGTFDSSSNIIHVQKIEATA